MISALKENKENGALSLTRLVMAAWVIGMLAYTFAVMGYLLFSDQVVTLNGTEQYRHEWSRYSGGLTFMSATFGAIILQYLGGKWIKKNGNGG